MHLEIQKLAPAASSSVEASTVRGESVEASSSRGESVEGNSSVERKSNAGTARRRPVRSKVKMQFEVEYLTKEQLQGFDAYKYSAVDTSPISNYVMHPFWNQVVKLVPKRIAPNALTFSGFMLNVVSVLLLSFYDFHFFASSDDLPSAPPVPPWVWLVCAVNQFLAHTLDGIDGKHARRTGLSGPMGELFDHGLDSWATLFMPLCVYSVFGRLDYAANPWRFYLVLWNVHFCFIASHWEKYNTGILYLPWGYDVSQIVLTSTFLYTYSRSYAMWKMTILGVSSGAIMEGVLHVGAMGLALPVSFYNIYKGYRDRTLRHYSWWEGTRPLISPGLFFVLTTIWVSYSPTNILDAQPRVMFVMIGTLFSNIATRLIINQMSATRCELFNWMLTLVASTLIMVFQFRWNETFCLYLLTSVVLIAHVHYGVCVVRQMCDHFSINCFSVERREKKHA